LINTTMSKPTIFITGSTGNVGQSTFEHLDRKNFNVKVGVYNVEKGKKFKDMGVEVHEIDFRKKDTLLKAFKGVDRLFIIPPGTEDRGKLAMNAIEAAKEVGVKFIALFSVVRAEERRILFQKQFADAEEALKKSGMKWVILQSPWFQENVLGMKDGVYLPLRDGATPFVSVKDLGRAIAAILFNPEPHIGKVYHLTGPQLATGEDIAKALSQAYQKEIKCANVSPLEARKRFQAMGYNEWQIDGVLELLEDYASKRVQVTDHIKQITGAPPRSIFETAKATVSSQ